MYSNNQRYNYVRIKNELINQFDISFMKWIPTEENKIYSETIFSEKLQSNIEVIYSLRKYLNIGKEIDYWLSASSTDNMRVNLFFARIIDIENRSYSIQSDYNSVCSIDMTHSYKIGQYDFWLQDNPFTQNSKRNLDIHDYDITKTILHLNVHENFYPTNIHISSSTLYISEDSNISSHPDLYLFDLKDSNLNIISSINTGPGIADFTVDQEYIFVANRSTTQQLQIMRRLGTNMTIVARYRLPLVSTTTQPTLASSIIKYGNYIILGTEKWDGNEINIFDIENITNPILISQLEIDSKVSDMKIMKDSLFIASSQNHQLKEYDISDIYNPRLIHDYYFDGSERQDGKIINIFENSLVFGRTNGGFNITNQYELFYYNDYFKNDFREVHADLSGGVYGILSDRKYIYIISRKTGREFEIFDKDLSSTSISLDLSISPKKMICSKKDIYILGEQSPFIYKININSNE